MPSNTRGPLHERSAEEREGEEGILRASQPEVAENKPAGWQGELRQESQQPRVAFKLQHFVSNPPPRASTFPSVEWRQQAQRLGIARRT